VFHPEVHMMVAHAVRDAAGGRPPVAEHFGEDALA
jgi:malate dehydrogenase (oxaloacetate-decarboxylating)